MPSSWVAGNGETERFLYYDGPTLANSPVSAQLKGDSLLLRSQPMFHVDLKARLQDEALLQRFQSTFYGEWKDSDLNSHHKLARNRSRRPWRDCLFIEVGQDQPSAFRFRMLAMNGLEEKYELADQTRLKGKAVEETLPTILLHRGLTKEEAGGLIASWRDRPFY